MCLYVCASVLWRSSSHFIFSHLPKLKNDQKGYDFLILIRLENSCAEPRTRAFAQRFSEGSGSVALPLPPLRSEVPKSDSYP